MTVTLNDVSGILHAEINGTKYNFNTGKAVSKTAPSVNDMDALLRHIEKEGGTLTDEVKTLLKEKEVLADIAAHGGTPSKIAALENGLSFAFNAASNNEALKAAELVQNPSARKFLSAKALEEAGIKDVKALDGYLAAREELTKLIAAGGDNAAKLEKVFIDNHAAPEEVRAALAAIKVSDVNLDLAPIAKKAHDGITATAANLNTHITDLKAVDLRKANADIALAEAKTGGLNGEKLKTLEDSLKGIDAERKAITDKVALLAKDNPHYDAAKATLEKDATIAKIFKEEKVFGGTGAASKGANWIKGGKWYSLMHDAESAGQEVAKIGKFRWGKAGIIAGAAAITYAAISAIGGKGPGEHAESVNKGREAEPAAGRA